MLVAHRRTLIVLGALVVAMTVVSAVLLVLEPRPGSAGSEVIHLTSLDGSEPQTTLFNTTPAPDPRVWKAIVIHHSGTTEGSAATIDRVHERLNLGGLGYHFVIDNGRGGPDGEIEVGFRWKQQRAGAYSAGPSGDWFNRHAIGICLIGDPQKEAPSEAQIRELVWLVRHLQVRLGVPTSRVLVQGGSGSASASGGGRFFPEAAFRQQLLNTANP